MVKKTAAKKRTSKAVTKAKNNLPANLTICTADAGAGLETTSKEDFAIPMLRVIQKMSPQVDEDAPEYIEDAKPGMLLNTVTMELFNGKDGLTFLACAYARTFIRWGARGTESAGFKGEVSPEDSAKMVLDGEVVEHKGLLLFPLEDGTLDKDVCDRLSDTRNWFGLILDEDSGITSQVLLSLSSTQIKKSKQLASNLNAIKVDSKDGKITPPTWVNRVTLTTIPEKNDKGSWHGVTFRLDGFIGSQEVYDAAKDFHDAVASGGVKASYTEEGSETNEKF